VYNRNRLSRFSALLCAALCLSACAAAPPAPAPAAGAAESLLAGDVTPLVGSVRLRTVEAPLTPALSLVVASFDPGLPESTAGLSRLGIFPEIRRAEARFMPVLLRQVLQESNAWGPVRVLPEPQTTAELQVDGRILHSDGRVLLLQVRAVDAMGQVWLDRRYRDESQPGDYVAGSASDPFIDLYRQVANDLLAAYELQQSVALAQLPTIALLRQARILAPAAFDGYLAEEGALVSLRRAPSEEDPMMARVQRIRDQEYRFIDAVDQQYVDLFETMQPTYNLWRQFGREQAEYREDYAQRLAQRDRAGPRGTFAAMEQTYNAFKWSKIQQQDLEDLARGFNNEVQPTVLEASGSVYRLSGSLENQYAEWREILEQIFRIESGLP
jgi:hypothetical protein